MKNKKNDDVKKPEVEDINPFDPSYQIENRTEPIEDDPFVSGDDSTNKEHDTYSKKQEKEKNMKKYYKKYYGGEIGDSAQYPGGHI